MATESTTPRVVAPQGARWPGFAHAARDWTTRVACATALGGTVAVSLLLVLAAAERPSFLSGPARHGFPGWMVGPLANLWPALTTDRLTLEARFTGALVILLACWLVATAFAPSLRTSVFAATLVVLQAIYLLAPPLPLTDLFNYLHYGRMGVRLGLNPYVALPIAGAHDASYPFSNWHHLPSPYGPLFTVFTYALAPLSVPTAYWAWKAVVALSWLACLAIVWWLARRLGRSPQRALAFVGLNPAVLVYGIGGAHNDTLMMLCVLGAIALVVAGRDALGGVAAVAGGALKISTGILAPLVVLGARNRLRALAGAAAGAVATGLLVELVFGGHLPAVRLQDRLATPLSIPSVLGYLAGAGGADANVRSLGHVVLAAAAVGCCAAVALRRERLIGASGVLMLFAVLTLAWAMPWYVGWILPFAALVRRPWLGLACVLLTIWLGLNAIPQMPELVHSVGYYPTRTAVGKANHELTERLLK